MNPVEIFTVGLIGGLSIGFAVGLFVKAMIVSDTMEEK